jgi:hypothetical protein
MLDSARLPVAGFFTSPCSDDTGLVIFSTHFLRHVRVLFCNAELQLESLLYSSGWSIILLVSKLKPDHSNSAILHYSSLPGRLVGLSVWLMIRC